MESVAIYPLLPVKMSDRSYAKTGYGIEFAFQVGEIKRDMSEEERAVRCTRVVQKKERPSCDPKAEFEIDKKLAQIRSGPNIADTTYTAEKVPLEITIAQFEVTVASRVTEIGSDDVVPGWHLGGRIQEFPTLTIYTTLRPDWPVSPYFGGTFTLAELKGVRLTQDDSTASVEASSSGAAGSFGLASYVATFTVFAEMEYSYLRFNTPGWKRPVNLPATANLPRRLDLNGLRFSFGIQIPLEK
jgi:hypothetical protein